MINRAHGILFIALVVIEPSGVMNYLVDFIVNLLRR